MKTSLRSKTIAGVAWTTAVRVLQQVVQFVLAVVLMRLLGPEAFGLMGMVLVVSGFALALSDCGFASALVQRETIEEEHRSTAFTVTVVIGGLFTVGLLALSPALADFYREPSLELPAAWMSLGFVLTTPGMVSRALLQRGLRFDVLARVDLWSLLCSSTAAFAVAVGGGGVWSLVVQQLVGAGVGSILSLWHAKWRPGIRVSRRALRELFRYGAGLTGFNVINYWARSADKLLIGRYMGSNALGLYSRAYSLMLLPLSQIVSVLAPVMFPALSSIQDDKARVRAIFLRVIGMLSFVTFPMMTGLIVVADPFVRGVLGARWVEAIPLIQILAVVGMTQTLCNPTGWIYTSQGRTGLMFWWGVGGAGFLILSIFVGIALGGVKEVALAYLAGNLIVTAPCLVVPGRLIGMTLWDVWRAIQGNVLCSVGMAALLWVGSRWMVPAALGPMAVAILLISCGVVLYAGLAWVFRLSALAEVVRMAGDYVSRDRRPAAAKGLAVISCGRRCGPVPPPLLEINLQSLLSDGGSLQAPPIPTKAQGSGPRGTRPSDL